MQDIFKKYKKHKKFQNLAIITTSFFLALWVNTWLVDSNMSQYLKSNILESQIEIPRSDIYIQAIWDYYEVKTASEIHNLEKVHFSLLYNNKNLKANIIENNIDKYIINNNYLDSWVLSIQLEANSNTSIEAWETLLKLKLTKNTENIEHINILNANFSDTNWTSYLLTSSGYQL